MKKFLLAPVVLLSLAATAQNLKPVAYKPSPKVTKTSEMNMTMNLDMMGQAMEIGNNATTTSEYVITDNGAGGMADMKILKVKGKSSMMGQEMDIDSDNPGDAPGAESLSKLKEQVTKLTFNKFGVITSVTKPESADAGGDLMSGGLGGMEVATQGKPLEFLVATGGRERKPGDVWMDSVVSKGVRVINTYTYQGTANNESLIDTKTTMEMERNVQQGGMDIVIRLAGVGVGQVSVDPAKGTVLKRTINADMKGTMDMMGNSAPVTMKLTTNDVYTY